MVSEHPYSIHSNSLAVDFRTSQRQPGLMTHWPRQRFPICAVSACKYLSVYIWCAINKQSTRWRQAHTNLIISENVRFQHRPDNKHKAISLLCISSELQAYMCKHTNCTHMQRQHGKGPFCLLNTDEKLPTANFNHIRKWVGDVL